MVNINPELEKRLKKLEAEQTNQDKVLDELSFFNDEVRKLEAILTKIDDYKIEPIQKIDFSELRDWEETKRLEKKLARIDEEYVTNIPNFKNEHQSKTQSKQPNENILKTKPATTSSSVKTIKCSYVICLMFNPKLLREWSETGWCEKDKGTRYKNLEETEQVLQKLQERWPSYPLKIFKKDFKS